MLKKLPLLFLIAALLALCLTNFSFTQGTQTEQITITTYYPSPYGVYKNVRLFPYAVAPNSECANKGEMAYSESANTLLICNGTHYTQVFSGAGGGGGGGGCYIAYYGSCTAGGRNMGSIGKWGYVIDGNSSNGILTLPVGLIRNTTDPERMFVQWSNGKSPYNIVWVNTSSSSDDWEDRIIRGEAVVCCQE
ncbi:MAG: hypothetical protein NC916_02665 [Candidatus Omnitrophica bacterium]|nr:hypothetical protein [Candidatus Omnitrophota bacterium]